jgi:hypothetical protein
VVAISTSRDVLDKGFSTILTRLLYNSIPNKQTDLAQNYTRRDLSQVGGVAPVDSVMTHVKPFLHSYKGLMQFYRKRAELPIAGSQATSSSDPRYATRLLVHKQDFHSCSASLPGAGRVWDIHLGMARLKEVIGSA